MVTLTFTAVTDEGPGTYCNEVQVVPDGDKTRSGQTAIVEIESSGGLCPGDAVTVSQEMVAATLVYTDTFYNPYVYTLDVQYTIELENIGSEDLAIAGFIDLLPVGYFYVAVDPNGDITEAPSNLHHVPQLDRQRVTWNFSPDVALASGETINLTFDATGTAPMGMTWIADP